MALCDLMYVVDGGAKKAGTVDTAAATLAVTMGTAAAVGTLELLGVYVHQGTTSKSGYMKKSDVDALNPGTVSIPANFAGLEAEMVPTRLQDQLFRVVDVVETEDYVEVTARHVWYDNLKNYTLWEPNADTDYTGAAVCRNILTNAISPVDSRVASDCTDTKKGDQLDYVNKNLVECFLDPENGVCAQFDLSLIRDNWDFYCLKTVGYDRGFVVEDGKNLLGVERKESIENLATRVAPFGKDKKGKIVWLNHNGLKYIDSEYIGDYSCPHVELYDTGLQIGKDGVTAQNIQEKLLAAGEARFTEDHVDLPNVEMTIQFLSIGDTEEYAQYRDLDKVYLYDIITIHDKVRGYSYTAQVVGIEHDILTGMLNSVTIGKLDNWDGTRKIATWQVPEVNGENIRLLSIQAGAFEPGAINGDDIADAAISYAHFASATIDHLSSDSITAVTAHIHEIIAGSITADDITAGSITTETLAASAITAEKIASGAVTTDKLEAGAVTAGKIAAGAITTEKLDAYAVTAQKIAANAVSADKIAAGAISASKIDTTDLAAINATLGTATIADARIAAADISYAKVKDLSASSAYFGQAVIQEGLANKLFIPRLSVVYAQIVSATISDLVIQATNDNFYKLDVDMDGNVTATQVSVSAAEIAQGHTTDGRTIYLGTDIVADDLNTTNIYASHALMDEITATTINVNKLLADEAFITWLNVQDISSNTYIQSTIGNWTAGSTITQEIGSLNSRISELGYGTVYMQPDEPDHSHLVSGDIWIQTMTDGSWQEVYDDFASWNEIYSDVSSWQVLGSIPIMWVWDGVKFQQMYDALLPTMVETEIQQLATAITLKASREELDIVTGEVTEMQATLTVMSDEIESAVSTVNAKAASFVMWEDPRTAYDVTLGDIWVKRDLEGFNDTSTWHTVYDEFATWNALKNEHDSWGDMLGDRTYVWNGSAWVETSDRASEVYQKTLIDQTSTSVKILAETTAELQGDLYSLSASLTITNERIAAEVQRATSAEGGKLDKTNQYQTADQIVNSAESWIQQNLQSESWVEQTATGIGAYVADYVSDTAYTIKSGIEIKAAGIEISGAKYIKIKSGGSFSVDSGNFSINTSGDVTLTGSITATSITANQGGTIAGWTISATRLSSGSGNGYVALDSDPSGTYAIWAGNATAANAAFWVKRDGSAKFSGTIVAAANSVLGGWVLGSNNLHSGSGSNYIALASSGTYAMYAGSETASLAPFRLNFDGTVSLTSLNVIDENGDPTTVNLQTAKLWKLNYGTIKNLTVSNGYCTSITFSNAISGSTTVNFNSASSASIQPDGAGSVYIMANSAAVSGTSKAVTVAYDNTGTPSYSSGLIHVPIKAVLAGTQTIGTGYSVSCSDGAGDGLAYDAGDSAGRVTGWQVAYNGSQSVRTGADISVKIPSTAYGVFSSFNYQITVDSAWQDVGHLNVYAKINGITVDTATVRANKPA